MSPSKSRAFLAVAFAGGLGACATQQSVEDAEFNLALETAKAETLPATAEEIEAAKRADPLTAANFWSNEYEKNPANLETSVAFASALREIGSHERALEIASQTLILYPESDELLVVLGQSLMSMGQNQAATDVLLKATALNPLNADAFAIRGLVLDRQERHRDAQRSYMRALALDPTRSATRSNYAMSLTLSGELRGAETALREALEGDGGENIRIRENLALVLGLQGKFADLQALTANNTPSRAAENNEALLRGLVGFDESATAISPPPVSQSNSIELRKPEEEPAALPEEAEEASKPVVHLEPASSDNPFQANQASSLSGARLPRKGMPFDFRGQLLR